MVQSEQPLTDRGVEFAIRIARMYLIPLNGLTLFQDRFGHLRVFINSTGIFWRLHHDARGVRSFQTMVSHAPSQAEPYLRAEAHLVMGDGSEFHNEAWSFFRCSDGDWLERSRAGQWVPVNLGDRVMAGLTKAARRVATLAVGISLPIYEDAVGDLGREAAAEPTPAEPETFADFVKAVRSIGLTPVEATKLLQMSLAEIAAKPKEAWLALQSVREVTP